MHLNRLEESLSIFEALKDKTEVENIKIVLEQVQGNYTRFFTPL
jgi:hypothetical protein